MSSLRILIDLILRIILLLVFLISMAQTTFREEHTYFEITVLAGMMYLIIRNIDRDEE